MKAKNILMSILLVMGSIAAKAATGYPPELALVSQPVMVYNYSSITVYYDVENIGDYTYRGYVYIYLDPDYGYYYAKKYVKVNPGGIKRVAIDIPARRIDRGFGFTIMPYYELNNELYSFTTFEYFEPLSFYWNGPRNERWVVITVGPRPHYYTRPGSYRFYYDGFRPPMPPPPGHGHGHGHGTPPPMDPMHHTYNYHHNNGGYPATHNDWNGNPPAGGHNHNGVEPGAPHSNGVVPEATVRPNTDHSSSVTGNGGNGSSSIGASPSGNGNRPSSSDRPASNGNGSSNVGRPSSSSGSSSVSGTSSSSRPAASSSSSGNSRPSGNSSSGSSSVSRPSSSNSGSGSATGRTGSSSVSRPSSSSNTSSARTSSSSSSRVSSTSSSRTSVASNTSSSNSSTRSTSSGRSTSSAGRR